MRALNEQKQLLQDLDYLLNKMEQEIELLRNINYRYYLMHGNKVQNGLIKVPENISFDVSGEIDGDVLCRMIDHEKINLESNYQKIKSEIRRLS
jgi:hypothetical protein